MSKAPAPSGPGPRQRSDNTRAQEPAPGRPAHPAAALPLGDATEVLALQRTIGNRAVARLLRRPASARPAPRAPSSVQRVLDLQTLYPKQTYPDLYEGFNPLIEDFQRIQQLLADTGLVAKYLGDLSAELKRDEKYGLTGTKSLDISLAARELFMDSRTTILPEGSEKSGVKIPFDQDNPRANVENFLQVIAKGSPIKDVGAPLSHGEYAHRIQWYIIYRHYLSSAAPKLTRSSEELYKVAADKRYVIEDEGALRKDDRFRSLWDNVNDVRGSEVDKRKEVSDAYAASPVKLTQALTWNAKGEPGELVKAFPHLAKPVMNRRLKRELEAGTGGIGNVYGKKLQDQKETLLASYKAREVWLEKQFFG